MYDAIQTQIRASIRANKPEGRYTTPQRIKDTHPQEDVSKIVPRNTWMRWKDGSGDILTPPAKEKAKNTSHEKASQTLAIFTVLFNKV